MDENSEFTILEEKDIDSDIAHHTLNVKDSLSTGMLCERLFLF